mmetsp:Transcript_46257/g.86365  ORF Transcript_46257/g.86365 Transcript_46257/m.86365 type:complete len:209 (-) Transcript_46257:435-1061(-)
MRSKEGRQTPVREWVNSIPEAMLVAAPLVVVGPVLQGALGFPKLPRRPSCALPLASCHLDLAVRFHAAQRQLLADLWHAPAKPLHVMRRSAAISVCVDLVSSDGQGVQAGLNLWIESPVLRPGAKGPLAAARYWADSCEILTMTQGQVPDSHGTQRKARGVKPRWVNFLWSKTSKHLSSQCPNGVFTPGILPAAVVAEEAGLPEWLRS